MTAARERTSTGLDPGFRFVLGSDCLLGLLLDLLSGHLWNLLLFRFVIRRSGWGGGLIRLRRIRVIYS